MGIIASNGDGARVIFTCGLCSEEHGINDVLFINPSFPVCTNCIKDLKEIIIAKRRNIYKTGEQTNGKK